ncbi:MAG: RecX family transcriptional regulator [Leptospira sp.]|nr:RecX family transcriptional regulator [Leptospira sp.]
MTQSGQINDRRFCENRNISMLKLNFRGRDLVRSDLISIGLDQDIIDESIAKVPEQEWLQAALNIGAKYLKSKSERNQKNLFNLKNKLYRNGFDEESVEFVLKHFGIKTGSVTDGN